MSFLAELITFLDNAPPNSQIDEKDWLSIISFYQTSDNDIKNCLVTELTNRPTLKFVETHTAKLDEDHKKAAQELWAAITTKELEFFKRRVLSVIPNLKQFNLSDEDLHKVEMMVTAQKHKRLTYDTFMIAFSKIKNIEIEKLTAELRKKTSPRTGKPVFHTEPEKLIKRRLKNEGGKNPLIFSGNLPSSPLKNSGVRILDKPPSPIRSSAAYPQAYFTPGKKTQIRPLVEGKFGTLYKPITPDGPKPEGKINTRRSHSVRRNLSAEFEYPDNYIYVRPKPISYTVTQETIARRQGQLRPITQKQLTGASCHQIFKADGQGSAEYVSINGHDHHWTHMIAYFLGGNQSQDNLVPATAAANYNILETVENFVIEKLLNPNVAERVKAMHIEVSPYYAPDTESHIPDLLIFQLKWVSPEGSLLVGITKINPRSYQRNTGAMNNSISVFRQLDEQETIKQALHPDDEALEAHQDSAAFKLR